jgi:predicted PurR-regulated permease PerM
MENLSVPQSSTDIRRGFETIATFAIAVGLLYFAAGILIPIVLAILLAFALAPVVNFFSRRCRIPDPLAVIMAVFAATIVFAVLVYLVSTQLIQLAYAMPGYQQTIAAKLVQVQQKLVGMNVVGDLAKAIQTITHQISAALGIAPSSLPQPVTIANDFSAPVDIIRGIVGSLLGPLATLFIVAIFLIFILMARADIQERFIRLASGNGYSRTTIALRDAGGRLSRYLLTQLGVNVCYGAIFGAGLMLIGIPGALLWGMLIAIFRYIPFVGALIVAIVPFLLAFSIDKGWSMLIETVIFFAVLDQTTANIVEPRLYGARTGLSGIAILLSAMFWGALWGPLGLILSTPMTVCLVVLGRYMPFFKVFETVLGSEPVLTQNERLYQRLLRGDVEEAIEITDELVEADGRDALYGQAMLPVLQMAAAELSSTPEALTQRRVLARTIENVINEYGETPAVEGSPVLIVGAQSELDEVAAHVLAQGLHGRGIDTNTMPALAVRQETLGQLDLKGVRTVVLVYLDEHVRAHARYVAGRLKRRRPDLGIYVLRLVEADGTETAATLHVDRLAHSFGDMLVAIEEDLGRLPETPAEDLTHAIRSEETGKALAAIAKRLHVQAAMVNLLEDARHQQDEDAFSLTKEITSTGEPLVIHADAKKRSEENRYLLANGIAFYAGVPFILEKAVVGALAVVDYEPHEFDEAAVESLKRAATQLARRLSRQAPYLATSKRSSKA